MNEQVGIWIDHQQAVIVSVAGDHITSTTLRSEVGTHRRYSGPAHNEGERQYEAHHDEHLRRFYDNVIERLHQPAGLLIFGPGEAKLELQARLAQTGASTGSAPGIETTDRLTKAQIIAKVKEHFELAL